MGNSESNSQSGITLTGLMVGVAISGITAFVLSRTLFQSTQQNLSSKSDIESTSHWSKLLSQTLTDNCKHLEALDTSFLPIINQSVVVKEKTDFAAGEMSSIFDIVKLAARLKTQLDAPTLPARDAIPPAYVITKLSMVQQSKILGTSPPRVLTHLKIDGRNSVSKKLWSYTIPLALDLTPALKIANCVERPTEEGMCTEKGGTYIPNAGGVRCILN